jgi:hypothetical protein
MRPTKKPRLMSNDGSNLDKGVEELLAEDARNATMKDGLLDRLDSFSPDYDKDLVKRLKNRPVSSREQKIFDYLAANNISPRKSQRIAPTFVTNTGGKIDYSIMGPDHLEAFGHNLPWLKVSEVTPNAASDTATRVEEDIHSLQKDILGNNKPLSSKSRKNKRQLKKELKNADFTPEEYDRRVKGNYALSGKGSLIEFEAKMIATKMVLLQQGILDSADEVVTEKKLDEIIAWKRNQFDWDNPEQEKSKGKIHDFTTILYSHDSPKMRKLLLKTFNDL